MTNEEAIEILKDLWRYEHSEYPEKDIRKTLDMAIKALEQESCEDVMAIHTQGLAEGIRCAMCTNSIKSDRGCDGCCIVDEDMYKKVMDTIRNYIVPPATPKRKVGEWIKKNNDYFDWYECSECGYGSEGEMKYNRLCDVRTKFCPDCGSQNLKGE